MRKALLSAVLAVALLFAGSTKAAESITPPVTENLQETLNHSTLALYHAEQQCAWAHETVFVFVIDVWECKFVENFTCTATVIARDGSDYLALTAGHCFDWKEEDKYYVGEDTVGKPVLHKVKVVKFENDERYDFGVVEFTSISGNYTPIRVNSTGVGAPPVGTQIKNVNFSYGIVKEFAEGKVVSDLIQGDAGGRCPDCKGRYLVSIGLGPGASGSAVVDPATGEIVGLVEAIFPETQMPTVVMPTGKNLINFMEDDSAGIKPLPEGPKPKEDQNQPGTEDTHSRLGKILLWIFRVFSPVSF
jgi:hypothetical protein